jgi:RNA polymerase sigma-70 factor (ECF subfamily)
MPEKSSFCDLLCRVRAGEEAAAVELLRRYEPAIRRTVRARLRDSRLRRLLDSMDIAQSVLTSFFVNVALGRYELERPEDLLQLLTSMAHHKLTDAARQQRAQRRDQRRVADVPVEELEVLAAGPSPSQHVATQELLQEARRRLSAEERRLLELRDQGQEWAAIATTVGGQPDTLRKQLARALERVAQELGLNEVPHE